MKVQQEATEMPQWRLEHKYMVLHRKRADRVPTSKMLRVMKRWYKKPNPSKGRKWGRYVTARKMRLLEFVDASDSMWRQFVSRPRLSSREFVELNLGTGCVSLSKQQKLDTLCFLEGVDYIKAELLDRTTKQLRRSVCVEDVVELHKRVTGADHDHDHDHEILLQPLISMLTDTVHDFGLAGRVLQWFHEEKPFEDGNCRLGELIVSLILRRAVPGLPFPSRVRALEAAKAGIIAPTGGAPDFAAFVVEQAWLACPVPKLDRHVTRR